MQAEGRLVPKLHIGIVRDIGDPRQGQRLLQLGRKVPNRIFGILAAISLHENRHRQLLLQGRHRTDVVEVPMGQQDLLDGEALLPDDGEQFLWLGTRIDQEAVLCLIVYIKIGIRHDIAHDLCLYNHSIHLR